MTGYLGLGSNEGDRLFKIDVNAAIVKYQRAVEVYPVEHRIYWKLAAAYERRSDWLHMADALTHATALAPTFASYWFRLGFALVSQAEEFDPSAYERAKAPLKRCIELDPNIATSATLLAERLHDREGFHVFVYPFCGRLANEGIATLVAARWARRRSGRMKNTRPCSSIRRPFREVRGPAFSTPVSRSCT